MSQEQQASLYFNSGNSNKEYHAQIVAKDDGFIVTFQYGRIGTTLKTGVKTAKPVPYEKAQQVFEKLVKSKTSKGYSFGEEGVAYQHTDLEDRATGIFPQLLNPITQQELPSYINSRNYCLQEKHDGVRVMIKVDDSGVIGINRKGLQVGLPATIEQAFIDASAAFSRCLVDGECIGNHVVLFDVLELNHNDYRNDRYEQRLEALSWLAENITSDAVAFIHTAHDPQEKQSLLESIKNRRGEGVVFKELFAPYEPGRPASYGNNLKYKFYVTASVIVTAVSDTKRSVTMGVKSEGHIINVGNVTVPANQDIPSVGQILEVRYLYAYPNGGSLYQPTFLMVRADIDEEDCDIGQLKYKAEAA